MPAAVTDTPPRPYTDARLKVGLEVHVELATRSKMWTDAPNLAHPDYFDAAPNTLLDPVVIGMPGTLPVPNREAIAMAIRVGLALNCRIAQRTKWDRKGYYYPDLPKNYQISQYDLPLCGDGAVDIRVWPQAGVEGGEAPDSAPTKRIGITRAHLEEDAGKLLHEAPGGRSIDDSIVDLNRAGTPLLEVVTEPDFETAAEAVAFCQMLRETCRHLGVSEGILQRGHMRFEPNINVELTLPDGSLARTPVVEIKNLNSFRAVHGAIVHEYTRQIREWQATGREMGARAKSTRGWDDVREVTTPQRDKEDEDEYRYFPDPDLVEVNVSEDWLERIRQTMPELPADRRHRYAHEQGLDPRDIDALIEEPALCRLHDAMTAAGIPPIDAAKLLLNAVTKLANDRGRRLGDLPLSGIELAAVTRLASAEKIGSSAVPRLLEGLADRDIEPGGGPDADEDQEAVQRRVEGLAESLGLVQVSDTAALEAYVEQVLADEKNARAIEQIRGGKDKAIGALMGQIMKLSKGQANPRLVTQMIKDRL